MAKDSTAIVSEAVDAARLTAKEMAQIAGVHQGTLSKYVNESLTPDPLWTVKFIQKLILELWRKLGALEALHSEAVGLWQTHAEVGDIEKARDFFRELARLGDPWEQISQLRPESSAEDEKS